jgi:hypothetical protein
VNVKPEPMLAYDLGPQDSASLQIISSSFIPPIFCTSTRLMKLPERAQNVGRSPLPGPTERLQHRVVMSSGVLPVNYDLSWIRINLRTKEAWFTFLERKIFMVSLKSITNEENVACSPASHSYSLLGLWNFGGYSPIRPMSNEILFTLMLHVCTYVRTSQSPWGD